MWNPVKELKVGLVAIRADKTGSTWNPVKELKDGPEDSGAEVSYTASGIR